MNSLADLQVALSNLSHNEDAIGHVQKFCSGLKGTEGRIALFNSENAIIRRPIEQHVAAGLGFNTPEDEFVLLQGDLVTTESAYFLGERVVGRPKYAVLNSSCDLVPGRATCSSLLRIVEIKKAEQQAKEKLGMLLKFSRRDSMYIPPLPDDAEDVVGNVIQFDGMCQIKTPDLLLANRLASLSLVGWRIYASFARTVLTRANQREVTIRTAIEQAKEAEN